MCKNKPKVVPLNRYLTGCFEFNFKVATFVVQTYVKKKKIHSLPICTYRIWHSGSVKLKP